MSADRMAVRVGSLAGTRKGVFCSTVTGCSCTGRPDREDGVRGVAPGDVCAGGVSGDDDEG